MNAVTTTAAAPAAKKRRRWLCGVGALAGVIAFSAVHAASDSAPSSTSDPRSPLGEAITSDADGRLRTPWGAIVSRDSMLDAIRTYYNSYGYAVSVGSTAVDITTPHPEAAKYVAEDVCKSLGYFVTPTDVTVRLSNGVPAASCVVR